MDNLDTVPSATLQLTPAATERVKDLLIEEGNPNLMLRAFVQGGGCSGFSYGFVFEEAANDDDHLLKFGGVTVLVDAMSMQYLTGASIDFKDDLSGSSFVINNPNANTTCGCGSSFSV